MALRLTEAEARKMGLSTRRAAQRRTSSPSNGHQWEHEGSGLRCVTCTMWLPYRFLATYGHGEWQHLFEETRG